MKRFLALWFSNYKWARWYVGGKWLARREKGSLGMWVEWNDPIDLEIGGWPIEDKAFVCEEY